jgi:ketosteroid isomerase-like protein
MQFMKNHITVILTFLGTLNLLGQSTAVKEKAENFKAALLNEDIKGIEDLVAPDAIFMLEYQRTLRGYKEIKQYYTQLFSEQESHTLEKKVFETIMLGEFIIEMGFFRKDLHRVAIKKQLQHEGKFWHIWRKKDGELQLYAYAEGFHRELPREEFTVIGVGLSPEKTTNLELRAYAALGEKIIKEWDPETRIELYAKDAVFYPFADSAKVGIEALKPYLRSYHQPGVKIDHIKGIPFEFVDFQDYILQFSTFEVDWRFEDLSGTNKGKGMRLWQRQEDCTLKIYRHIALHNYLNP